MPAVMVLVTGNCAGFPYTHHDADTLTCMCRCKAAGVEACNFEMAWAELAILRRQGSGCLDVQSRPAALRAFDRLIARGILHVLDPRYWLYCPLHRAE